MNEKTQTGDKKVEDPKVIVSLTSFPAAIRYAGKAVDSLLKGSVLPDKIILYLTFEQFGKEGVPHSLIKLSEENPIFEIRDYPRDIRSYRKLIPALKEFPDDIIVTVDDDVFYHRDMLRQLLEFHKQEPGMIIAHRAKRIIPGKPYKKWKKFRWYHFLRKRIYRDPLIMQTGVAGVLYPPGSLKREMLDPELFMKIAPTTDDIWFWAAAIANNKTIVPVPFGKNKPKGMDKPKEISLKTFNFKKGIDNNLKAFNDILEAYPELQEKIFDNFAKK